VDKFKGKYRIDSIRLKYWDYSSPGIYFITICTNNRECFLGEITNGEMLLSQHGEIVKNEILKMANYHHRVVLDEWIIMPNHIHLLIELTEYNHGGNGNGNDNNNNVEKIHEFSLPTPTPTTNPTTATPPPWWRNPGYQPTIDDIKQYRKQRRKMIIPKILGKFQMQTSKQVNILRNTPGDKNWQPNYHDHIIRDDSSYHRIKNYIINNPKNWVGDKFYNLDN